MKICFVLLLMTPNLMAAVSKKAIHEEIALALRQPHEIAVKTVRSAGGDSLSILEEMAFNDKWPMKTRWKSFMVMAQVKGKKGFPQIKKALLSKTWFMRSAGLTALKSIDQQAAKKWAYQKLNSDPALLVRMKALEILKDDSSEKVKELFWRKIYSADSLHGDKSLWIRGDLARLLLKKPQKKNLKRWVRLLHGSDQELQAVASYALSKLSSTHSGESKDVSYWRHKYPKVKNL